MAYGRRPRPTTMYASQNFPDWSVASGYLTIHGAQLLTILGGYYRQCFVQQGLLTVSTPQT